MIPWKRTAKIELLKSRDITNSLAFRLLGWMESQASMEIAGTASVKSAAQTLIEFVEDNLPEIAACREK